MTTAILPTLSKRGMSFEEFFSSAEFKTQLMTLGRYFSRPCTDPDDIYFNIDRLRDVPQFHSELKSLLGVHTEDLGDDVAKAIMQSFVRQVAFANIEALVDAHSMSPQQLGARKSAEAKKKTAAAAKTTKAKSAAKPKSAAAAKGKAKSSAA